MTETVLLASQGIYNRNRELFGTELLFRNDKGSTALEVGEDVATSEVLLNHCSSISKEIAHLRRPVFINVCADFFLSEAFLPIDPSQVYIELVERIDVDEAFVNAVKKWKKQGYRFALDDFEFTDDWRPLLGLADVVKIDVLGQKPESVVQRKIDYSEYNCLWLAERIETQDEYDYYKSEGFDLFQGYFLSKPKLIKGKNIRPEQTSASEILKVTTSDSAFEDIASAVERDPKLSLQILKMVNSPLYSLQRPIESIKDAVVFLGVGQLRKWALLLSLVGSENNCIEAHRVVLNRAKFCEFYALQLGEDDPDRAFMVGLLSGLDILLGVDPGEFINLLNLTEDIKQAVVFNEGRLGKILKLSINLERIICHYPERLHSNKQAVLDVYHESFYWTEEILRSFAAP